MKKLFFVLALLPFFAAHAQAPTGNVIGLNVGNIAPEILMKNPNDSTIALSSLRGKMVLIDFWASWCGPCRGENPNVVRTWRNYRDSSYVNGEGFTIFSVSLDRTKDAWKAAIKHDSLDWPCHVSDLQFWSNAAAQTYQVYSIPTNVLIDGNGVIIAKGLRGEQLEKALATQTVHKKKGKPASSGKDKGKKEKGKKNSGTSFMLNEDRRNIFGQKA